MGRKLGTYDKVSNNRMKDIMGTRRKNVKVGSKRTITKWTYLGIICMAMEWVSQ